ncbi:MAG: PASTA domain-containing protein [Actinomycetota bacterium]|nr:PASTA domain-containing protein [Actinomycetota bacterium]
MIRTGPGSLDRGFGAAGTLTTSIGPSAFANAVALDSLGRIVAAGPAASLGGSAFALARYRADGTPDPGFGSAGAATTSFGAQAAYANAVAAQPDGKVIAAGFVAPAGATSGRFALVRYRTDGSLDSGFGRAGLLTAAVAPGTAVANAVAVQADGKILAGGVATGDRDRFALARFERDGRLDTSFGHGGFVTSAIDAGSGVTAFALQPDGKIVAAGWSLTATTVRFALARYLADGNLDASFGTDGVVTTRIDDGSAADDVLVQADGKVVVAGGSFRSGHDRFALARYDRQGRLDPSFGSGGRVATSVGSGNVASPVSIAVQPSGKLIAAGSSEANWMVSFAVARYDSRGRLDSGFGDHGGVVTTAFELDRVFARGSVLQPDGKIVVAGYGDHGGYYRFALARYVVVGCVVPDVRGSRLVAARKALARADCGVGRVSSAYSRTVRRGHVAGVRPGAGARLLESAKVNLVVSRGRRR